MSLTESKELGQILDDGTYLTFLHLHDAESGLALKRVRSAVLESGTVKADLRELLDARDWSGHLLAAVALPFVNSPGDVLGSYWAAVDGGSWVAPQLVAVLEFIDPDFIERSVQRIGDGCTVSSTSSFDSDLARHILSGSGGSHTRSVKAVSALAAMLDRSGVPGIVALLSREDVREMRRQDRDGVAALTVRWQEQYRHLLAEMGIKP